MSSNYYGSIAGEIADAGPVCSTCQMPVVWGTTASGKPIPLDPDPVDNGNLAVRPPGNRVRYMKRSEQPGPGEWRAVSHFATCRDAGFHRKH